MGSIIYEVHRILRGSWVFWICGVLSIAVSQCPYLLNDEDDHYFLLKNIIISVYYTLCFSITISLPFLIFLYLHTGFLSDKNQVWLWSVICGLPLVCRLLIWCFNFSNLKIYVGLLQYCIRIIENIDHSWHILAEFLIHNMLKEYYLLTNLWEIIIIIIYINVWVIKINLLNIV